jgi:hypothetical protein
MANSKVVVILNDRVIIVLGYGLRIEGKKSLSSEHHFFRFFGVSGTKYYGAMSKIGPKKEDFHWRTEFVERVVRKRLVTWDLTTAPVVREEINTCHRAEGWSHG